MPDPLTTVNTRVTPQSQPIPGQPQVRNSAGGYVYAVDDWTRFHRFLILGVAGGTFYVGEQAHLQDNVDVLTRVLASDGPRAVAHLVSVSLSGSAPRQEPTLFTLAVACAHPDEATRKAALRAVPQVCRTGTMLFQFTRYAQQFRGWGSGLKRAIAAWYVDQPLDKLVYQAVKYRQREGMGHRDLLRLTHPKVAALDPLIERVRTLEATHAGFGPELQAARADLRKVQARRLLFDSICRGGIPQGDPDLDLWRWAEDLKDPSASVDDAATAARAGLPWEAFPDQFLNEPAVWDELLDQLGLTAMIRQLPRLTRLGLVTRGDSRFQRITDVAALRKARVHPVQLLNALVTYSAGVGTRGDPWVPVPWLLDVLDEGFHAAFGALEPTGKRHLIAVDCSGSMSGPIPSLMPKNAPPGYKGLTSRAAAAALAMQAIRLEESSVVVGFTSPSDPYRWTRGSSGITPLALSPRQRLDDAVRTVSREDWGATNCSLPMLWALREKLLFDVIVVITDNETWAGPVHPSQALQMYRQQSGLGTRLAVIATTSTGFSIADPADAGQLDLVGFDLATPQILAGFARGEV